MQDREPVRVLAGKSIVLSVLLFGFPWRIPNPGGGGSNLWQIKNTSHYFSRRVFLAIPSAKAVRVQYDRYWDNPKVKWKDSIKKVVGLVRPTRKGLNI